MWKSPVFKILVNILKSVEPKVRVQGPSSLEGEENGVTVSNSAIIFRAVSRFSLKEKRL
ncbi:hypothetical protein LEP1GSC121_4094 [Leptospira borgpetersenii serovar Castellonis str. 200801910]|uniref:Uncharacterized protein n=1 Tax=Leptospira borgpetersenii str. Brem 328 TaxID=1049780 RepID=A0ABC9SE76_LEPBO|nr:hypothetical protein LEP1GSC121_4094 [Leptospira borgpetersenii serovar Castellonis str. 200801910]EMN16062.1 hypothetical protein LEP1GSC056_0844 [Leptospira borgpetersenii str. Brem 328]